MSLDLDTGQIFNAWALSLVQPSDGSAIAHERTVIREFFVARLVAALNDTGRVHSDPLLPHQARPNEWKVPALNVSVGSETSAVSHNGPTSLQRTVDLIIDVIAAETNTVAVERLVDQLELLVVALIMHDADYPVSIYEVVPVASDPLFSADGARRLGRRQITFKVTYHTALSEPLPAA